jgi:4-deoxy-L-threo-5-hexosulose-uronate ketol-isomerase
VLDRVAETGTASFLDRRELAVVNIGEAPGTVAAGQSWELAPGEVLYLGRGAGPVRFGGQGRFYLASAPAHASLPSRRLTLDDARRIEAGAAETANRRTILQFVHPEVMESCQLVLGYTRFAPGSVWNTMPAHTHDRRMEAYLYFGMEPGTRVFHMMGEPAETRHIVVANEEAVLSPPWSIHCGCGTGAYAFVWAMAGDNVDYRDMDMVAMDALR